MATISPDLTFPRAIVVGSSGGIGAALAQGLAVRGFDVTGLSRSPGRGAGGEQFNIELCCEASIEAASVQLRDRAPFSLILIATGLLHDAGVAPEKSLRDLDQGALMRLFAVNAVGPALLAKYFVPLLPRQSRCVFAALTARVGSIGDNRLGGWYGYRASKTALNMFIKTLSIELARTRPEAICVGLHPGTVDTGLSKPFQAGVAPDRLFSPTQSATHLLDVIEQLTPLQTGRFFGWDGAEIHP